jgi:hypothetical protein
MVTSEANVVRAINPDRSPSACAWDWIAAFTLVAPGSLQQRVVWESIA